MGGDGVLFQPLQQDGGEVAVALQTILQLLRGEQQTDRVVLSQTSPTFCPAAYKAISTPFYQGTLHRFAAFMKGTDS